MTTGTFSGTIVLASFSQATSAAERSGGARQSATTLSFDSARLTTSGLRPLNSTFQTSQDTPPVSFVKVKSSDGASRSIWMSDTRRFRQSWPSSKTPVALVVFIDRYTFHFADIQ